LSAERRRLRPVADTPEAAAPATTRAGRKLVVEPARLVPGEAERWLEARRALRVLYRDFLAGGGLDLLADRRSDARPVKDARQRRAA
jgi:hypothetical protein